MMLSEVGWRAMVEKNGQGSHGVEQAGLASSAQSRPWRVRARETDSKREQRARASQRESEAERLGFSISTSVGEVAST